MNRCKTCKHWKEFPIEVKPFWGICEKLSKVKTNKIHVLSEKRIGAEIVDKGPHIETYERFGCTEYEQR